NPYTVKSIWTRKKKSAPVLVQITFPRRALSGRYHPGSAPFLREILDRTRDDREYRRCFASPAERTMSAEKTLAEGRTSAERTPRAERRGPAGTAEALHLATERFQLG